MATQPKRAVLHQVLTTAARSDGGSLTVAYVFDEDHDRHLVFATSPRFHDLRLLPLMQGIEVNLIGASPCLEVLPLRLQSEEVQEHVAEQLSQLPQETLTSADVMATRPTRAVLQQVMATAISPDGTAYIAAYVVDAEHDRHLVFATGTNFEDPRILPLMKGQEIRLTSGSPCLEVLPLSQQSEEVQHQVAEQLSQRSIESLICAG